MPHSSRSDISESTSTGATKFPAGSDLLRTNLGVGPSTPVNSSLLLGSDRLIACAPFYGICTAAFPVMGCGSRGVVGADVVEPTPIIVGALIRFDVGIETAVVNWIDVVEIGKTIGVVVGGAFLGGLCVVADNPIEKGSGPDVPCLGICSADVFARGDSPPEAPPDGEDAADTGGDVKFDVFLFVTDSPALLFADVAQTDWPTKELFNAK